MKNYYFTFGSNHKQIDGTIMEHSWVRVLSDSYINGRLKFIEQFSSLYMEAPDKWSFQYTDLDFNPKYFPRGEYCLIS